jgi:hypothetical protein
MATAKFWTSRRVVKLVATVGALVALILVTPWARQVARRPALAAVCTSNMEQISLALSNYVDEWGAFPPAHTADAAGRPLLSWRVLLLPYLERADLLARFKLDEPWDGPNNSRLLDEMPRVFACPVDQQDVFEWDAPGRYTDYLAAAGPGTAFPGAEPVPLAAIQDGPDRTIVMVESAQARVPWTAPVDLDARSGGLLNMPAATIGPTTPHATWFHAATADDRVFRLDAGKFRQELAALASIAGGEDVRVEDLRAARR